MKRKNFNHELYHDLRKQEPGLNSAMIQSIYRTVEARYKTVATQLKQHPYHYQDRYTGKWYSEPRTLDWLRKSIYFKRPQADYVRNINYSFVKHGTEISMNVLSKRIKVAFQSKYIDLFDPNFKLGTAKLVCLKKHWFLHISITKQSNDFEINQVKHVVGIDRGLRFIGTVYDEQGKTSFISGKQILRKRAKYQHLRAELQRKGTKSAKRVLKRISKRENRWITDVNHQISKTLVDKYGKNTLFVLEDLTSVNFELNDLPKRLRNTNKSWAFYQLEQMLAYKAHLNQSEVKKVNAQYTSQRCIKCGSINKDYRNHDKHEYYCQNCGYRTNDDRLGAMNIQQLGTEYISGNEHPKIIK